MMKVLCKMLLLEFYNANFFTYNLDLLEEIKYICRHFQQDPVPYQPNSALFLVSINSSFKLQTFNQIDWNLELFTYSYMQTKEKTHIYLY